MKKTNKIFKIVVADIIKTVDNCGELIKKTLEKVIRVFRVYQITIEQAIRLLLNSPSLLSRPPTNESALLVKPRVMANFVVTRGFILPLKLNLGCGGTLKDEYINIDIQEPNDIKHNFTSPLEFPDNSVDEIYSRDVIQHFDREEWKLIKKDWVRVLKPGGIMKIECWDFEWVLKEFLTNQNDPYAMQRIYAGQDSPYDYFKNGFTYNKLISDLSEEGMTNFKKIISEPSWINITCQKF